MAVKTRTGTSGTGKLYFTFTDHLGNIAGLGEGSTFTSGSLARLDPFGNYRTVPSTNPTVTNQGFTGHRRAMSSSPTTRGPTTSASST